MQSKIKVKQHFCNKQRSKIHLSVPNFETLIKLCKPHQQICTIFGMSKICRKSTVMCGSCQKHKHDDNKHSYLEIKDLIQAIKTIKEKYKQFHRLYINQMVPEFLSMLKIVVLQFMQGIETWDSDTLLLNHFMSYSKNKNIKNLFNNEVQNWDLNSLNCKDMSQIFDIVEKVKEQDSSKLNQIIQQDLKSILQSTLMIFNLIPNPSYIRREQEEVFGGIQQIISRIKQMNSNVDKFNRLQIKNNSNLIIKLTQETLALNSYNDSHVKQNLKLQQFQEKEKHITFPQKQRKQVFCEIEKQKREILQKTQIQINQKQQEINKKLAQMLQVIYKFLRKCHHPIVKLIFKIPPESIEFWEFLFQKLISLAKETGIKRHLQTIIISSPIHNQVFNIFCSLIEREQQEIFSQDMGLGRNKNQQIYNQIFLALNPQLEKLIRNETKNKNSPQINENDNSNQERKQEKQEKTIGNNLTILNENLNKNLNKQPILLRIKDLNFCFKTFDKGQKLSFKM